MLYLCTRKRIKSDCKQHVGAIAQLVEQRTENPCVPGSIPGGTTVKTKPLIIILSGVLFLPYWWKVIYFALKSSKKVNCFVFIMKK